MTGKQEKRPVRERFHRQVTLKSVTGSLPEGKALRRDSPDTATRARPPPVPCFPAYVSKDGIWVCNRRTESEQAKDGCSGEYKTGTLSIKRTILFFLSCNYKQFCFLLAGSRTGTCPRFSGGPQRCVRAGWSRPQTQGRAD